MPSSQLPPLGALLAFEAAAESGTFADAAKKLFVTPAAVSQQIRTLEQLLEVTLFERSKMGVTLTRVGQSYLIFIHEALEKIRLGQQQIKQFSNLDVLTITSFPSIASKWLMPHTLSWMESHIDVEVRVEASHAIVDFNRSASDMCICFGNKHYSGLTKELLFTDTVSLVASPLLLKSLNDRSDMSSILELPMIHIDWGNHNHNLPDWSDWFEVAGIDRVAPQGGPHFNLSSMAIDAAVKGKGLLLGQNMMIKHELETGQLIPLSDIRLPLGEAYYLTYPKRTLNNPQAANFIHWIKQKAKEN